MATYVRLRIDDDAEAKRLVEDFADYPDSPVLTPCQENMVYAALVDVQRDDEDQADQQPADGV